MVKFIKPQFVLLCAVLIATSSCVNLKSVNEFSDTSIKSLQNYERLEYSFTRQCLDKCDLDLLSETKIYKADSIKCDCEEYKKADKASNILYQAIAGYFENLQKVSDNELATYKLDTLKAAITEGTFGNVEIKKETVDAYSIIVQKISQSITDGYRKKKTKQFISEANEPLQNLLKSFQTIINTNLKEELIFKQQDYYFHYSRLLKDKSLTMNDNANIMKEYYQKISEIGTKKKQIENFSKGLDKIMEGHQQLFDNKDKMTDEDFKDMILSTASDIKAIISEFKKIK